MAHSSLAGAVCACIHRAEQAEKRPHQGPLSCRLAQALPAARTLALHVLMHTLTAAVPQSLVRRDAKIVYRGETQSVSLQPEGNARQKPSVLLVILPGRPVGHLPFVDAVAPSNALHSARATLPCIIQQFPKPCRGIHTALASLVHQPLRNCLGCGALRGSPVRPRIIAALAHFKNRQASHRAVISFWGFLKSTPRGIRIKHGYSQSAGHWRLTKDFQARRAYIAPPPPMFTYTLGRSPRATSSSHAFARLMRPEPH